MKYFMLVYWAYLALFLVGLFPSKIEAFNKDCSEKILITGGAGFIGSHVAEALLQRGNQVVILDNFSDFYDPGLKQRNIDAVRIIAPEGKLHVYVADICDAQSLKNVFIQERPTLVCHLAGCGGVRPSINDPGFYLRVNVIGTQNILDCCRDYGVKNLVFASSSSVYGKNSIAPFDETDVADRPCSPYAATKRAAELLVHVYHNLYGLSCTCLRFFTVYGPRGRPDMAPFKFLDAVHNGNVIMQYGDGLSRRDFTYVGDIVNGVIGALDSRLPFEIINLGRSHTVTLSEFISTIEEVVGKKAVIQKIEDQAGDVPLTFANISKAQRLLGYAPKTSLREGLTHMYEWYLTDYMRIRKIITGR